MKTHLSTLVLFVLAFALVACGNPTKEPELSTETEPADISLDELIEKHTEALGGAELLASLEIVHKEGTVTTPDFTDQPIITTIQDDKGYLRKIETDGQNIQFGYDGEMAWEDEKNVKERRGRKMREEKGVNPE